MEIYEAAEALAALAHETRLEIFRYLVRQGPQGKPVGALAERFDLPNATLSFHLKNLKQTGLITVRRDGRSLFYSPNFSQINAVMSYLIEDCCQGEFEPGASDCQQGEC